ncbi:MAG: SDR family NAD(P)-dependent oxidoreductase [Betaproteobacteria bacterium]|nr:SDR family NAD(P)-dependent oxidoreductase [Betaproteobacteria bacterium]MBK9606298.1 SDR family NAD(P)-dependent oxidoreductase [Betaproteobacteria bacterium]
MNLYIVTGASRGLGLGLARILAAEPESRLVAISRAGLPRDVRAWRDIRADLGVNAGQDLAAKAIRAALAAEPWRRAVLINNAGMLEPLGVAGQVDAAVVQHSVGVNLTAAIVLMNAFLVGARDVSACSVVNISSGSGRRPSAGSGVYCAAKAGLDMVSRVAALEVEAAGRAVTICSLAPGIIDTDMQVVARGATAAELPDVARFRAFKSEGLLKSAAEVARKIIDLERAGKLPPGIADLREL